MVTVSFIWIISGNLHEIVPPLQRLQCYFGCLNLCNVELISFKILSYHLLSVSGTDQILTLGKLNLVPYSARTFGQFYKNHARVKKDQNLILAFIDELWKTRKSEFWKNENKFVGDIIMLHMCTKNHDHMLCSWDMARDTCNCYFSYWAIFCPFISLTAHKITCVPKVMNRWYTFSEIWPAIDGRTDRQTNGWTDGKSDIKRWVSHLKIHS